MSEHPWRGRQQWANGSRRQKEIEGTSAFWRNGFLVSIGYGDPYASFIEYQARLDGRLLGRRWTGEETEFSTMYIADLKARGIIDGVAP